MNHATLGKLGMMGQRKKKKVYHLVRGHIFSQKLTYANRGIPKSITHQVPFSNTLGRNKNCSEAGL